MFSQRFVNRMLHPSTIIHSERTVMVRRYCSDRVCLFLSVLLLCYIAWNIFNPPKRTLQYNHDPTEELAYVKALNASSPIIENTQICALDKVDIIFLIISSSSHFLERQSIRETWASMPDMSGIHSQHLFVVGYHFGGDFYKDLSNEASHERDLLYLTVNDYSVTLKEMHAYRWLDQHCPNVVYMFKTEDDLFINSLLLHELIRELKTKPNEGQNRYLYNVRLDSLFAAQAGAKNNHFLFGWAFQPGRPERNHTSPFYITQDEYAPELYPQYCSGFGYLMTSETRRALTKEAFNDKHPFRFAAIYMTGILPERLHFTCDLIPFTFLQSTTDECVDVIKRNNGKTASPTAPPLLVCTTGRHIGQNAYSDYYRIWSDLKNLYADRLSPTNN